MNLTFEPLMPPERRCAWLLGRVTLCVRGLLGQLVPWVTAVTLHRGGNEGGGGIFSGIK